MLQTKTNILFFIHIYNQRSFKMLSYEIHCNPTPSCVHVVYIRKHTNRGMIMLNGKNISTNSLKLDSKSQCNVTNDISDKIIIIGSDNGLML